jgi:hypothetical protein
MKLKHAIFFVGLAAVIGGGIVGGLWVSGPSVAPEQVADGKISAPPPPAISKPPNPLPQATEPPAAGALPGGKPEAIAEKPRQTDTTQGGATLKINGYEVQDPIARLALNFVGSDPDADAYWVGAINDSSLPAEERKDLIEDLNEDGLSDPHHPTAEDMPLILARIQLIERVAPNAIDDVNRDAFGEAYKDLRDLLNGREPQ